MHLKDFSGQKSENMYGLIGTDGKKEEASGKFEFRPVGYGLQDVPSIIAAFIYDDIRMFAIIRHWNAFLPGMPFHAV